MASSSLGNDTVLPPTDALPSPFTELPQPPMEPTSACNAPGKLNPLNGLGFPMTTDLWSVNTNPHLSTQPSLDAFTLSPSSQASEPQLSLPSESDSSSSTDPRSPASPSETPFPSNSSLTPLSMPAQAPSMTQIESVRPSVALPSSVLHKNTDLFMITSTSSR